MSQNRRSALAATRVPRRGGCRWVRVRTARGARDRL